MIKYKDGTCKIKGSKVELLSDLTGILHSFEMSEHFSREDVDLAVELSRLSDEERSARLTKELFEMLTHFSVAKQEENDGKYIGN